MLPVRRRTLALLSAAIAAAAVLATGPVSSAAAKTAGPRLIYTAPNGSGTQCSSQAPCSITTAQQAARLARKGYVADVHVVLDDGTYRLTAPLDFGAADSGSPGHPVEWTAAPGAHPVLSGATRVTDWTASSLPGVWSASVPAGSASRQLYVNGTEAPLAQATPSQLQFSGGWKGSATGYDLTADPAALAFFSAMTPDQLQQVEFDYPGGNGQWTDSKCRVQSLAGSSLTMDEPCWTDITNRATYADASGDPALDEHLADAHHDPGRGQPAASGPVVPRPVQPHPLPRPAGPGQARPASTSSCRAWKLWCRARGA